jgi:gliding motility-associated-like protein
MTYKYLLIYLFLSLFLIIPLSTFSQGEANNWYFGQNAGINFNNTPPTVLFDGQLNTNEGCSSISSPSGELLFYTDGRTIWNTNHQIMSNADYFGGTGLNGDPSSTSSGLIVPHPTQDNLYYVFTVDEPHHDNAFAYPNQGPANPDGSPRPNYSDVPSHSVPQDDDGFNNGFAYSLVDMNLNNGLGDVVSTEKNIELETYNPNNPEDLKYKCSEKITAVRAQDCNSVWVITHFKGTFYSFFIDDNGVNQTPVTSQIGPLVSTNDYRRAAIGYLKASPNGDKLITANQTMDYNSTTQIDQGTGNVYLFDFDNATGQVSNAVELLSGFNAYSVEFSPGGSKAYASVSEAIEGQSPQPRIFQWDIEADDIPASQFSFSNVSGGTSGAIQLAPNGKIYRSIVGSNSLAVINNPELAGVQANYTELTSQGALSLGGRTATFGLPPFIQSLFSSRIDIVNSVNEEQNEQVNLCDGESFDLFYEDLDNAEYVWLRDGEVLVDETASTLTISQLQNVNLPYEEDYKLEILFDDGTCPFIGIANVTYYPFPEVNSAVLNECATDFDQNTAEFDLTEANSQFIGPTTNLEDFNFTYFESIEDAQNNENAIDNPSAYTNLSTPQTLTVLVETEIANCATVMELVIDIIDFEVENYSFSQCDDNQNGIQTFDLNSIEALDDLTINNFYLTQNDALNEINQINNPQSFQNNNPYLEDVFFTIDTGGECIDLGVLTLEIVEIPLTEDETVYYCVEQFPNPIIISANVSENELINYEFLWLLSEETTPEIQVNEAGNFEVAITSLNTGCTNFRTIEVLESGLANYSLEIEEFFENNNQVTVNVSPDSLGDYEFSLLPNGPYQDSNVFENLLSGIYDMYVRDKNGCGVKQKTFGILGIMDYFTPNQDGINDVWEFKGVFNNKEALAQVYIFDRYGKLIKSFRGLDKYWDGFYNNKQMPSQDYWYKIQLESGRVLAGNFTLKR